jgi:hypothetical protein
MQQVMSEQSRRQEISTEHGISESAAERGQSPGLWRPLYLPKAIGNYALCLLAFWTAGLASQLSLSRRARLNGA